MPDITDPTHPDIDRWLRRQPPRVELALRYAMLFPTLKNSARFVARIDELFAFLRPGEGELAAIMRLAREIGAQLDGGNHGDNTGKAKVVRRAPAEDRRRSGTQQRDRR